MSRDDARSSKPGDGEHDIPETVRHAYRALGTAEPPDLLDQAVLNRARAAVSGARSERPWNFGWLHAVTTAAVLVLGLTLLLRLEEHAPGRTPKAAPPAPSASPAAAPPPAEEADQDREARTLSRTIMADSATVSPEQDRAPPVEALESRQSEAPRETPGPTGATAAVPLKALPEAANRSGEVRKPGQWLADIRRRARTGDLEGARAELAAFREAWPDYPVPDDILAGDPEP